MPSPNLQFPNAHDTNLRLNQTICKYKGKVVMTYPVGQNGDDTHVSIVDLVTGEKLMIDANDPDLDTSAPHLGYVNIEIPIYVSRDTWRQQSLGLTHRQIIGIWPNGATKPVTWNTSIPLAKMILGEYPDYDYCRKSSTGGAWTREMAVAQIEAVPVVLYRGDCIGYYDPEGNKAFIGQSFRRRSILESLGRFMQCQSP